MAWWLHKRLGRNVAYAYTFFIVASPLLIDITRQARGYGLASLAMSVVIVAALESPTDRRWVVPLCAAGVMGTWTLPVFGLAFVGTAVPLLGLPYLRRRLAVGRFATDFAAA